MQQYSVIFKKACCMSECEESQFDKNPRFSIHQLYYLMIQDRSRLMFILLSAYFLLPWMINLLGLFSHQRGSQIWKEQRVHLHRSCNNPQNSAFKPCWLLNLCLLNVKEKKSNDKYVSIIYSTDTQIFKIMFHFRFVSLM